MAPAVEARRAGCWPGRGHAEFLGDPPRHDGLDGAPKAPSRTAIQMTLYIHPGRHARADGQISRSPSAVPRRDRKSTPPLEGIRRRGRRRSTSASSRPAPGNAILKEPAGRQTRRPRRAVEAGQALAQARPGLLAAGVVVTAMGTPGRPSIAGYVNENAEPTAMAPSTTRRVGPGARRRRSGRPGGVAALGGRGGWRRRGRCCRRGSRMASGRRRSRRRSRGGCGAAGVGRYLAPAVAFGG